MVLEQLHSSCGATGLVLLHFLDTVTFELAFWYPFV
jgi:hypothetical protein